MTKFIPGLIFILCVFFKAIITVVVLSTVLNLDIATWEKYLTAVAGIVWVLVPIYYRWLYPLFCVKTKEKRK